jgi:hypothetical protein
MVPQGFQLGSATSPHQDRLAISVMSSTKPAALNRAKTFRTLQNNISIGSACSLDSKATLSSLASENDANPWLAVGPEELWVSYGSSSSIYIR